MIGHLLGRSIAILAVVFTTFQFLPQVYKTYSTRKVRDLSYTTICLWLTAEILWNIHGQMIGDLALIFCTSITSVCGILMLIMFHIYK